jgi:uncharacterized protein (DUF488 family)
MRGTLLYTIGYEGLDISEFLSELGAYGIRQIIDVRELPLSRKRGFSKSPLSEALSREGIGYIHVKPLGDPKPGRLAARSGDISSFRRIYAQHLIGAEAQAALEHVARLVKSDVSALLCYEKFYFSCHRAMIASFLSKTHGFQIRHVETGLISRERHKNDVLNTDAAIAFG